MRKILTFITIFTVLIFLVSCKKEKTVDIDLLSKNLSGNTYTYVFNVKAEDYNNSDLKEIAYSVVHDVYTQLSDKNETFYLNITINVDNNEKIILKYVSNLSFEKPGLTLLSEKIS